MRLRHTRSSNFRFVLRRGPFTFSCAPRPDDPIETRLREWSPSIAIYLRLYFRRTFPYRIIREINRGEHATSVSETTGGFGWSLLFRAWLLREWLARWKVRVALCWQFRILRLLSISTTCRYVTLLFVRVRAEYASVQEWRKRGSRRGFKKKYHSHHVEAVRDSPFSVATGKHVERRPIGLRDCDPTAKREEFAVTCSPWYSGDLRLPRSEAGVKVVYCFRVGNCRLFVLYGVWLNCDRLIYSCRA